MNSWSFSYIEEATDLVTTVVFCVVLVVFPCLHRELGQAGCKAFWDWIWFMGNTNKLDLLCYYQGIKLCIPLLLGLLSAFTAILISYENTLMRVTQLCRDQMWHMPWKPFVTVITYHNQNMTYQDRFVPNSSIVIISDCFFIIGNL